MIKSIPLEFVDTIVPPDGDVHHVIVFPTEVAFKLLDDPKHMVEGVDVTGEGADMGINETVTLKHPVVLQVPSDLT